jgi:cytochrome bd ubiquinol oxidase subunit I
MDALILSRIQFALNISFHYLFPPLSIGLSLLMIIMEALYLITKNPVYEKMTKFWVRIFAVIFAMGVASGLVQVFAFGTNWARFSHFVGDVFGSVLGAEGIFAFFLESGFIALLLFGWNRVTPAIHFLATCLVSFGAHFSGVWIVIANSWMQTPTGYRIVGEGVRRHAEITSWWEVVTNPSVATSLSHVIIGCWISGAFLVLSVNAYYLLKNRHIEMARRGFRIALIFGTVTVLMQGASGHATALTVAEHQPVKLAAFEGVYETKPYTPIYAFGWTDPETQTTKGLHIPGLLSFLVYFKFDKAVPGLDQFPRDLWPPVNMTFQTYHIMIACWGLMFIGVLLGWWAIWSKKWGTAHLSMWYLVFAVLFPQIANEMGWWSSCIGRQPWIVYGLMKTSEGVSENLSASQVMTSLILFSIIYLLLFVLFIFLLDKKIKEGPQEDVGTDEFRNKLSQAREA